MLTLPFGLFSGDTLITGDDYTAGTEYERQETAPLASASLEPDATDGLLTEDDPAVPTAATEAEAEGVVPSPDADPLSVDTGSTQPLGADPLSAQPLSTASPSAQLLGAPLGTGTGGGFTPYALPLAGNFNINAPLGGGKVDDKPTSIHI